MITIVAAQLFIQAFILCLILHLVARYEADYSFRKMAMVSGGIMLGMLLIDALAAEKLGVLVFIPQLAFITFMLMTFCWIPFSKSVVVVILFSIVHIGFAFGIAALKQPFARPGNGLSPADQAEQRIMEARQEMLKTMGHWPEGEDGRKDRDAATVTAPTKATPPAALEPAPPPEPSSDGSNAEDEPAAWALARRQLSIRGVIAGVRGRFVTINGKLYEEGDTVSTTRNGSVYRWRVGPISDAGPELKPLKGKPKEE